VEEKKMNDADFSRFSEAVKRDALKNSCYRERLSDDKLILNSQADALTRIKLASDTKAKRFFDICRAENISLEVGAKFLAAGSSGRIGNDRGNALNRITCDLLGQHSFVVNAEPEITYAGVSEIVDVLATLQDGSRFVIMCQVDLWNGGAQINRGDKYIVDAKFKDICEKNGDRWGCVVLKPPTFKTAKSKQFKIFRVGYDQKTLFYPTVLVDYLDNLEECYAKGRE
jgi:hypothetical protein